MANGGTDTANNLKASNWVIQHWRVSPTGALRHTSINLTGCSGVVDIVDHFTFVLLRSSNRSSNVTKLNMESECSEIVDVSGSMFGLIFLYYMSYKFMSNMTHLSH